MIVGIMCLTGQLYGMDPNLWEANRERLKRQYEDYFNKGNISGLETIKGSLVKYKIEGEQELKLMLEILKESASCTGSLNQQSVAKNETKKNQKKSHDQTKTKVNSIDKCDPEESRTIANSFDTFEMELQGQIADLNQRYEGIASRMQLVHQYNNNQSYQALEEQLILEQQLISITGEIARLEKELERKRIAEETKRAQEQERRYQESLRRDRIRNDRENAALKIQKCLRRFLARKKIEVLREEKSEFEQAIKEEFEVRDSLDKALATLATDSYPEETYNNTDLTERRFIYPLAKEWKRVREALINAKPVCDGSIDKKELCQAVMGALSSTPTSSVARMRAVRIIDYYFGNLRCKMDFKEKSSTCSCNKETDNYNSKKNVKSRSIT